MSDITNPEKRRVKSGYSVASFIVAIAPVAVLLAVFLFCLVISGGQTSDNDMGAAWWLMVAAIWLMIPLMPIADIVAVVLVIKGIKRQKTLFAWAGVIVVALEILSVVLIYGSVTIRALPAKRAREQEILRLQEEISNYDTYADLTPFGLGIYKRRQEGDKRVWDITKPEDNVITYDGVEMVYEDHLNRKDTETWDNDHKNSNKGKDVMYDVYYYDGTYLIVTPLWEQSGTLRYWGYIYMCKSLDPAADLYEIGITDPAVVDSFNGLPVERVTRKELAQKLGKIY